MVVVVVLSVGLGLLGIEANGRQTIVGVLLTSLTVMMCAALFAYFGFVLSNRQVAMFGCAGCVGGFALALLCIYLADTGSLYPSMPWNIVGYEFLKYGETRIPMYFIAPLMLLGGFAALGCRRLLLSNVSNKPPPPTTNHDSDN